MLLLLLFAGLAVVVVAGYLAMRSRQQVADESLRPEDQLTDEQFRRIEFGDDD